MRQWTYRNPWSDRQVVQVLNDTLPSSTLVLHLLATGFITGILDATTYSDFSVFTSNQTGNAVLLSVSTLQAQSGVSLVNVRTSLASFIASAFIAGQSSLLIRPGHGRTRWWTLLTSFYQFITILVVSVLQFEHRVQFEDRNRLAWLVILLLASSSGAQVAMARQFSVPEIPTAMLTSPFVDLLTDPHLFSLTLSKSYNVPRSRRVCYIVALIGGCFVGACVHRTQKGGSKAVILLAAILKFIVFLSFFFTRREVDEEVEKE